MSANDRCCRKRFFEARANPEVAEAKAATLKALQQTESGWRAAIRQISERGGLGRPNDGIARAAPAADVRVLPPVQTCRGSRAVVAANGLATAHLFITGTQPLA
jgi:hypothetical protein